MTLPDEIATTQRVALDLESLNPDQLDAVVHRGGPLLVVAGAGSGKTRVLTHRIAHLIHEGVPPSAILAITFTNKAADEMKHRVAALVGPVTKAMWVCTFHSACVRILRAHADRLGYPRTFSIYDQADAAAAGRVRVRDLGLDAKRFPPRAAHGQISLWKNELITPAAGGRAGGQHLRAQARRHLRRLPGAAAEGRRDGLRRPADEDRAAVPRAPRCAGPLPAAVPARADRRVPRHQHGAERDRPGARRRAPADHHRRRPRPERLRLPRRRLRNISQFEEAFDDVTTIVLDQNYRSTQTILDAANAVIPNNPDRKEKHLWSEKGTGDRIMRYHAEDEGDEATWVARTMQSLQSDATFMWKEMAAFYRTNAQSRVLEEAFMRFGIPYKVVGGTRFYDRREIKDAMAYLRAVVNPADEVSVKRVLNVPKRGVGEGSVAKLDALAASNGTTFVEAMRHAAGGRPHRPRRTWCRVVRPAARRVSRSRPTDGPGDLLQAALTDSGYLAELEAEGSVEAAGRLENIGELVGSAREFTRIDEFLEQVALVADTDDLDDDDRSCS